MSLSALIDRLKLDPFMLGLVGAVGTASLFPAGPALGSLLDIAIKLMIGLMFFLYGARLPREVVLQGLGHWRLHGLVLACTYGLFPVLGLLSGLLVPGVLTPDLQSGILFLCLLPSTVQSSIAFTSIARGNVVAAICSASASNLIGVLATPILVGLLMQTAGGGISLSAIQSIVVQILVPFVAGQIARPWIADWAERHRLLLMFSDRGAIILVVYAAFSEAVRGGMWQQLPLSSLAGMVIVDGLVLAIVLLVTTFLSRGLGFTREDEIAIVFCGSKKSLATGVPMANVLFPAHAVGAIVLPLMLFHQIQLMACAFLARGYALKAQRRSGLETKVAA